MKEDDDEKQKFLFIADAHVKARTWANSSLLSGDAYAALDKVEARIRGERLTPSLVIGGDWFDSTRPSSMDLYRSFRFREHCSDMRLINGNHDSSEPPLMTLMDDCESYSDDESMLLSPDRMLPIGMSGAFATGVGWTSDRSRLLSALSDMRKLIEAEANKMNYVVLHAGVKELLGFDGAYQLTCQDLAEAFEGLEVGVLVGHVHTRRKISLGGSAWLYSPGSLYPLSSDKMDGTFTVPLITADTGEIEEIDCSVRHYMTLKASDMCPPEGGMWSPPEIPEPDGERYLLPTFIRVEMDVDGFAMPPSDDYVVQYVNEGQEDAPEESAGQADGVQYGIEDAVADELEYDKDLAEMAVQLVTCDDPVAELASWLGYWKVKTINSK